MRLHPAVFLLFTLFEVAQGCRPARHVPEGKYVVAKNKVIVNRKSKIKYEADVDELSASIKQKAFRKWFGVVPFNLGVYNWASSRNQDRKLYSYLKEEVGEAPEIFEPVLLKKTVDQMKVVLRNRGYFDGTVEARIDTVGRKVKIEYHVQSDEPYTMRRLGYAFEDTSIVKDFKDGVQTAFNPGKRFDLEVFEKERTRMTNHMKNLGYFTFDKIHILFDVDTNLPGKRYDVTLRLRNQRTAIQENGKDSLIESKHRKHYIRSITVNESFQSAGVNARRLDTALHKGRAYLSLGKPYVRPVRLSRNIFIEPGDQYTLERTDYTYGRLKALGNFRFIDMKYAPTEVDSTRAELDLTINLTRSPRQSFSVETTGTHRSGNLGISASTDYRNRNLFRGAEQLELRIYGGVESQRTNSTVNTNENTKIEDIFNTIEYGAQLSLIIPDLFLRTSKTEFTWAREPKTSLSVSFDRQYRPQYNRILLNTNYQYAFRLGKRDQLIFAPIDLSVIELSDDDDLQEQLKETNNTVLINSYNDHIIAAGRISYSNTTQEINRLKNFHYYRINFESAGNLLRLASEPLGLEYDEENASYMIDSIRFAQYVKLDVDYVKYNILTENSKMVYRLFGGLGIPLTNLNVLPFERSFFAGGSNDIRAWRARALGPGGLNEVETQGIDQVGDVQLETNIEYRFKITSILEGAAFLDMGNIWFLRKDTNRLNAHFDPKRSWKEIAIAPGLGARLDLNFFVIRLDAGLQLYDPGLVEGERWVFGPKTETDRLRLAEFQRLNPLGLPVPAKWENSYKPEVTFNLAIHYPF